MNLPIKTLADIRKLAPCYDPARYAPEDWRGTALDVLKAAQIPAQDRIWVVCHEGWIDDRTLRLFAVWCAREVLKLVENPDPRSINACDVAERFANGEATKEELAAAKAAAKAAARDSACAAVWNAAWSIASAAARTAAMAAAWGAARDVARTAARGAARDAARTAAWAGAEARAVQIAHLIEMLEAE